MRNVTTTRNYTIIFQNIKRKSIGGTGFYTVLQLPLRPVSPCSSIRFSTSVRHNYPSALRTRNTCGPHLCSDSVLSLSPMALTTTPTSHIITNQRFQRHHTIRTWSPSPHEVKRRSARTHRPDEFSPSIPNIFLIITLINKNANYVVDYSFKNMWRNMWGNIFCVVFEDTIKPNYAKLTFVCIVTVTITTRKDSLRADLISCPQCVLTLTWPMLHR